MKKIIIFLCICFCSTILFFDGIDAVAGFKVVITNNVVGDIGDTITPQTVELSFDNPDCSFIIENIESDITSWFSLPSELNYTVTVVNKSASKLMCQFSGAIDPMASEDVIPITLTIPYIDKSYVKVSENPYIFDIDNIDNSNANYIINDPGFEIQYAGPYEIKGIVGQEIDPQIVKVEIINGNDEFNPDMLGATLPIVNGLTPTVSDVDIDFGEWVEITYTGTPINPSQDLIHTTINKQYMVNELLDRVVPDRSDVKFNIVAVNLPSNNKHYEPPKTGIR